MGLRAVGLCFEPQVTRVAPTPKRPFQGWRYLKPGDAPRDLPRGRAAQEPLPPQLETALAEIGVL